jgi:selenocysteine lyase/cysteine desulfurase
MAYDVARVRGLHPSLGDGWVHFDAPDGMLIPDSVATTVSTAFRGSVASTTGPHPSARRSSAVLDAARQGWSWALTALFCCRRWPTCRRRGPDSAMK